MSTESASADLMGGTSTTLAESDWREREAQHLNRARQFTAAWRSRQLSGEKHPVEDFLFTYYPFRAGHLERWHPGARVLLERAAADARAQWKWYRTTGNDVIVDAEALVSKTERTIRFIANLLEATSARTPQFGCFGLHEWAMVYRASEPGAMDARGGGRRHDVELRLPQAQTDAVVESHRIACSHFDAFRFFTPEALGLNSLQPSRENQPSLEQSGCLHAGMDVYKWATKLGPLVPGELLLDCFELARDIRELDMRASPYDLGDWGYSPVRIETASGKAEYAAAQRGFTARSNVLRQRVTSICRAALEQHETPLR